MEVTGWKGWKKGVPGRLIPKCQGLEVCEELGGSQWGWKGV